MTAVITSAPSQGFQLPIDAVLAARRDRGLVAVFDFDGTLVHIARTPDAVHAVPATTARLERLAQRTDTTVGVVSGRPLARLIELVPAPSIWLFGLHGWEHRPPHGVAVSRWPPDALDLARRQREVIDARLGEAQGERIEDKGPMVAVHTRNATPERRRHVERVVRDARLSGLELIEGRRVLELRPLGGPTKGTAVRAIAGSRPAAPVLYVGDDTTDEDAFAVLGPADFGVLVDDTRAHEERPQGSATRARWRVPDTESVLRLLHALAADEAGRRS